MDVKKFHGFLVASLLLANQLIWTQEGATTPEQPEKSNVASTPQSQEKQEAQVGSVEKTGDVIELKKFPFIARSPGFGAEACIAMALKGYGINANQNTVFNVAGIDPREGRGMQVEEIERVLLKLGFRPADKSRLVEPENTVLEITAAFHALLNDLRKEQPSIVQLRVEDKAGSRTKFVLVIGYSSIRDELIVHDPELSKGESIRIPKENFFKMWLIPSSTGKFQIIRFVLAPWELKPLQDPIEVSPADLAQRVIMIRNMLGNDASVEISGPFVVVGLMPRTQLQQIVQRDVNPVIETLSQMYFPKKPILVTDIWIARNKGEYEDIIQKYFQTTPKTINSSYYPERNTIVVNMSTGLGSLASQVSYPLLTANYPYAPIWLVEGFALLMETVEIKNNIIVGIPNWRLNSFKNLLTKTPQEVQSLSAFISQKKEDFLAELEVINADHARHFCYYIQQKGKLKELLGAFTKETKDLTGGTALLSVLGEKSLDDIDRVWRRFIQLLPPVK